MNLRHLARRSYSAAVAYIYRRSRFRLFLAASIESLDARVRDLTCLMDYFSGAVRPIPISAPFGRSMLVLAPHQDDETIGCGGALALQVKSGGLASVVLLQDGADAHEELSMPRAKLAEIRNEESRRAAAVIGLPEPVFLNHRSLRESHETAVREIQDLIRTRKVDAVFTPFLLDNHPDHRATNEILADALAGIPWEIRVFGYEVWGLAIPNVIVAIDNVIEAKRQMLDCFKFANSAIDYTNSTIGLNMYRTRLLGSGTCRYAECFFELPAGEFRRVVSKITTS